MFQTEAVYLKETYNLCQAVIFCTMSHFRKLNKVKCELHVN